ncbi:MAG: hypothetical protein K2Q18_14605 [Bdellovibrionales bacterium]|nr:hypothetical protein [Bdellovibrionales bacterium]
MKTVIFFITSSMSFSLFSHGMNQLGPHNGYIKMPGAFHTEILEDQKNILVYLIDMNFKNPMVENSSVSVTLNGKNSKKIECTKGKEYFICLKPDQNMKDYNEISVHAFRNKVKASPAIYKLPLKLEN